MPLIDLDSTIALMNGLHYLLGSDAAAVGEQAAGLDSVTLPRYYQGMALAHSKVTAQGQISVPAEVRRKLGIGPGSVLEWDEQGDIVVVRRAGQYTSEDLHTAIFSAKPKRRTLAELKDGVAQHMKRRHARNRH